jgi:type VI secretion system protein VasG
VFAESLFQWIEDAWVFASLQSARTEVRSGHLLLMFASRGHRYTGETFPELAALPVEALRKEFEAITARRGRRSAAAPADDGKRRRPAAASGGGRRRGGDSALRGSRVRTPRRRARAASTQCSGATRRSAS